VAALRRANERLLIYPAAPTVFARWYFFSAPDALRRGDGYVLESAIKREVACQRSSEQSSSLL